MIFNTNVATKEPEVGVGRYEASLEGALMYVYENECNYNALIKAAGISEMKYYQETGKDLFVNEAGALKSFGQKVVAFFKKVIEKIKQLFNKFVATINSFVMKDKDFVKKYQNDLLRKSYGSDFVVKGHKFTLDWAPTTVPFTGKYKGDNTNDYKAMTSEEKEKLYDELRADVAGSTGELSDSDFREYVTKQLFGEEEVEININSTTIRTDLSLISNTADNIKKVEKAQKDLIKSINDGIKAIEKSIDEETKKKASEMSDDDIKKSNGNITAMNEEIECGKVISNAYTVAFGIIIEACKKANREAKARCIKALQYSPKNEAAYAESSLEDLFAGVTIR